MSAPRVARTLRHGNVRHVVAILTERLGDLIVSTPALRNVRASLPDARLTLVCPPGVVDVLRGWEVLDEIVAYDPRGEAEERLRFVAGMRTRQVDVSIALTSNWPAYELGRALGARTRAGVVYGTNILPSLSARLFLTHPVRVWIREPAAEGSRFAHRAEELLKMNTALGLDATPRRFELPLSDADRHGARDRLARLGVSRPVVLHLAARWLQEGWTPRDVARLAEDLLAHLRRPLLLTAGPSDAECASLLNGDPRFTLVSSVAFREWASILEAASLVVTHDTSAVHVASALGRPVVAVYEAKRYVVQSQHWAPWMVPHRVLRKAAPSVTEREVVEAARSLLAEVGDA